MKENEIVKAGVGRKFQNPSIHDDLTVFENLEISYPRDRSGFGALTFTRDAAVRDRVHEVADVIFPKDRLNVNADLLRCSQQQQLAIACALATKPKVLLLDEPTEGIQPSIIKDTARTLKRIRDERGLSIVVSEQILSFALDIADRVPVIENGEIVRDEPRDNVDAAQVSKYLSVPTTV